MYFIAQGRIKLIANDKLTLIDTLTKGQHFGEIGVIYNNAQRLWYAQADTFSTVYILTKKDMDKVVRKNYPQVIKEMEESAKDKYMKLWVKNQGDLVRGVLKQVSTLVDEKRRVRSKSMNAYENKNMSGLNQLEKGQVQKRKQKLFEVKKQQKKDSTQNLSFGNQFRKQNSFSKEQLESEGSRAGLVSDRKLNERSFDQGGTFSQGTISEDEDFETRLGNLNNKLQRMRSASLEAAIFTKNDFQNPRKSVLGGEIQRLMMYQSSQQLDTQAPLRNEGSQKISPFTKRSSIMSSGEEQGAQDQSRKRTPTLERRLSEVSLGKNLSLSQSAGLQLQWTVSLQNKIKK